MAKLTNYSKLPLISMDPATQRGVVRTGLRPLCSCLDAQYNNKRWRELKFHREVQDTTCDAWKKLLDIIERCASDGEEIFEPGAQIDWKDWIKIVTLPTTISRLTSVKEVLLYGSNLVRIPPEIGEMRQLEVFDIYTSYRLHWLPYEITRCANLMSSRISTRALYGNYKYRPPFPRLHMKTNDLFSPERCSVCRKALGTRNTIQSWISLRVATDIVPLLVHACSKECVEALPTPPTGYVDHAHAGGLGLAQPPKSSLCQP
jgi:hypothetical protein